MLGIVLGVLAFAFAAVAWCTSQLEEMRVGAIAMVFLGGFCLTGALACFLPAIRPIALRLIGATVFLVFFGYLAGMVISGPLQGSSRGEMSLINSIVGFLVFGLPAGYVAVKGQYPRWGRHALAFGATLPNHVDTGSNDPVSER
jgi:Na+-driven multidrug efflux pump